jgi:hypothetical protein
MTYSSISMSSKSRHLLRLWQSHPLPTLKQGGTLSILSSVRQTNLSIQTEWRDDGHVSLLQRLGKDDDKEVNMVIKQEIDRMTSLGRAESHVSIHLEDFSDNTSTISNKEELQPPSVSLSQHQQEDDFPHRILQRNVILDDGTILPDSDQWSPPPPGTRRIEYNDGIAHITHDEDLYPKSSNDKTVQPSESTLSLQVPEKINLDCNLLQGGSISIDSKVEGDVRLRTTNGTVHVKKLRGHSITIETQGLDGNDSSIYASDLLEAQALTLKISSPGGRLRAKRIHATTVDARIGSRTGNATDENSTKNRTDEMDSIILPVPKKQILFDDDDNGALCDISSLYLSGDAEIQVQSATRACRAVRIKSSHGSVFLKASGPMPNVTNEMTGELLPLVELGGVNGACEVSLTTTSKNSDDDNDKDWTSCKIHFDSVSPDTISLIQVDQGTVSVTLDRKVESDLRLLSAASVALSSSSADVEFLLVEDKELDDNYSAFEEKLVELDNDNSCKNTHHDEDDEEEDQPKQIHIHTKAFTQRQTNKIKQANYKNIEFVDGWVENKSEEPDSRFDRKIRGNSSSSGAGGKIRLEGAAAQALQGFQQQQQANNEQHNKDNKNDTKSKGGDDDSFLRPLVVVAGPGKIVVETLSWLGNIARRYGLDDTREQDDLGRTATRRGRPLVPEKE